MNSSLRVTRARKCRKPAASDSSVSSASLLSKYESAAVMRPSGACSRFTAASYSRRSRSLRSIRNCSAPSLSGSIKYLSVTSRARSFEPLFFRSVPDCDQEERKSSQPLLAINYVQPLVELGGCLREEDEKAHEVLTFGFGCPQLHQILPQFVPLGPFPTIEALEDGTTYWFCRERMSASVALFGFI